METNYKQIYDFAMKWKNKFLDENADCYELTDITFSNECFELGFKMDCGEAFSAKYEKAFNNYDELKKIINEIDDIELLESAMHSQWRYFNHWAYSAFEILEPEHRNGFVLVLSRLAELSKQNNFI